MHLKYMILQLRGEPCGAVRHKVHHVNPLHVLLPQHRDWSQNFKILVLNF